MGMIEPTGPREQTFEEHLAAKLTDLLALAEQHGIPMFATFILDDGKTHTAWHRPEGDEQAGETIWRLGAVARRGWRPIGPMEETLLQSPLNEDLAATARHFDRYGKLRHDRTNE
jgi:hypothetical protein